MKNGRVFHVFMVMLVFTLSESYAQQNGDNLPVFSKVEYQGEDTVYNQHPLESDELSQIRG